MGAALLGAFHWMISLFGRFLIVTGVKMLLIVDLYKIPIGVSLGVIAGILILSILASLIVGLRTSELAAVEKAQE